MLPSQRLRTPLASFRWRSVGPDRGGRSLAVNGSDPDVVFIGMGETCLRGNIMPGDGGPIANASVLLEEDSKILAMPTGRLDRVRAPDLTSFDQTLRQAGLPPIGRR